MADRAKAGGEIGMNGEFYEGGQFIAGTTMPKGAPSARRANMVMMCVDHSDTIYKQGIQAGWTVADANGDTFPIYDAMGYRVTQYVGDIMRPIAKFAENAVIGGFIARFNSGERFITRAERDEIRNQR